MRDTFAHFALALVVGLPIAGLPGPAFGVPAPITAPALTATADRCATDEAMGLVLWTNAFRRSRGLAAVEPDARLFAAAERLAGDLAERGRIGHVGSDGSTLGVRVVAAGYPRSMAAENVAAGTLEASETVEAWVGSPGHLANLMTPGVQHVGAAHVVGRPACRGCSRDYWVLVLAGTRELAPPVPLACGPPTFHSHPRSVASS